MPEASNGDSANGRTWRETAAATDPGCPAFFFTRRKWRFTLRNVAMLQRAKISQYKKANSVLRKI